MDMGLHDFTFAIMPHPDRMQESGVYSQALKYVNPVRGESLCELNHKQFTNGPQSAREANLLSHHGQTYVGKPEMHRQP